jgi:hypothetical protein
MKHSIHKNYAVRCFTVLALVGLLTGSCNKLIEIPSHPTDKISADQVYTDSLNVMAALSGIYMNFGAGGSSGSINTSYLVFFTGFSSDELWPASDATGLNEIYLNKIRTDNGNVNTLWTSGYSGIYQTNDFLNGVPKSSKLSASLRKQVTGEALICRALYYFNLVQLFDGVPLITGTDYKENAVKPRVSADSVYAFIIGDLNNAITQLSETYPSAGRLRPNVHTARAMLAKVYLTRSQWQQAAEQASQVLGSNLYTLEPLSKVFLDGSKEAIWQMASTSNYGQTVDANYLIPYTGSVPTYALTNAQMNAFETTDQRKQTWTGATTVNTVTYYYPWKYKNRDLANTPKEYYMFFRAGEQFLIRAEANAQRGLLDSARADLNRIRTRAGLAGTTAVSKEDVLMAIERERQTEMFCEGGHRWFDLKRTGRATAVLQPIKADWQATDTLYPIPQQQMDTNPFLTQNKGYQ